MRALHDSRAPRYRTPYGAVAAHTPVTLSLDVWDAPDATVTLRTWIDGVGEGLYEMCAVKAETATQDAGTGNDAENQPVRYQAEFTPDSPGVVWYHFIVQEPNGETRRYGTSGGRIGGIGALDYGEPPSYQLTVFAAHDPDAAIADTTSGFNYTEAYPFQEALASFLRGELSAYDLAETVETIRETYPARPPRRVISLLDRDSRARQFTQFGGIDESAGFPQRANLRFDESQTGIAKGRLWLASLLEALMPDVSLVCRNDIAHDVEDALSTTCTCATYPWGCASQDCGTIARNAVDLCRSLPLFASGKFSCFAANDDVFGFWRYDESGDAACILVNASLSNAYDIPLPICGEAVSELIGGYGIPLSSISDAERRGEQDDRLAFGPGPATRTADERNAVLQNARVASVHLNQLGSAIAYVHANERLGKLLQPGIGVLAHITSLPGGKAKRPGTLGAPARAFVDMLAKSGVRYWQVLPVNPTDNFGSPYAGISAFAGNTMLLEGDIEPGAELPAPDDVHAYQQFCEHERYWLEPYACFMAIRQKLGAGKVWQEWPEKYRRFDVHLVESDKKLRAYAENWRRSQFAFEQQWKDLRAYANDRGVQIIGDMPIYVSADSSDVWASPELFQLQADGRPATVAGCPPDAFSAEGQTWGNPVYDWDAVRASGYEWWLRRLERAFELYDIVRLDHFIGFSRYYSIPNGRKATEGAFHSGPGIDLFRRAFEKFGPLPIIAEDLGLITPGVRTLSAACGFPGMDIVQFVDGNDPLSGYQPRPEKIAYTGTHDNQTLIGYCEQRYPDRDARKSACDLMRKVASCASDIRIFPLQDLLGLDDSARMNVPGTSEGNWIWQAKGKDLSTAVKTLAELQAEN